MANESELYCSQGYVKMLEKDKTKVFYDAPTTNAGMKGAPLYLIKAKNEDGDILKV